MKPVADGTLVAINLSSRRQIRLIGRYRLVSRQIAGNARLERHLRNLAFQGQRRIGHCHRRMPPLKPRQKRQWRQNQPQNHSKRYGPWFSRSFRALNFN